MAPSTQQYALAIAKAAREKKAGDVLVLDVRELTSIADYFVIASGDSERQVNAIANHIDREMSKTFKIAPVIEGAGSSMWLLLDFGDIVAHVFKTEMRQYYALEKMWADAPQVQIPDLPVTTPALARTTGLSLPSAPLSLYHG